MKKHVNNNFIILFVAIFSISINAEYRLGLDYTIVDNPLPVKKDGIVEVTESFWYGCGGCYSFEPAINDWASKQGSDIKFSKMPVPWSPVHQLHAALYYTIDALKLDPSTYGTNSETVIAINLDKKIILICGTEYAGETKNSVFSLINYLLTYINTMPLHC